MAATAAVGGSKHLQPFFLHCPQEVALHPLHVLALTHWDLRLNHTTGVSGGGGTCANRFMGAAIFVKFPEGAWVRNHCKVAHHCKGTSLLVLHKGPSEPCYRLLACTLKHSRRNNVTTLWVKMRMNIPLTHSAGSSCPWLIDCVCKPSIRIGPWFPVNIASPACDTGYVLLS